MQLLIWIGAVISVIGLAGILWVAITIARAKRAGLEDSALRAVLQKAVIRNMLAFFIAMIGLMMVVVGIFLR